MRYPLTDTSDLTRSGQSAATISAVLWAGAVFTPTDFVGFVMIIVMVFLVR